MEINNYVSPMYTSNTSISSSKKSGSNLGMDEFLTLLAAQLANQDMMNPSSDTEFIAQMAQFSSLQAMDSMAKMTSFNQSTNLIGKNVVVATYDRSGLFVTDEGIVEKVNLFGDEPTIVVNGKEYTFSNVMEIKNIVVEVEENKDTEGTVDSEKNEEGNTEETNNL